MADFETSTSEERSAAEIWTLSWEMARAYKRMAACQRNQMALAGTVADAMARDLGERDGRMLASVLAGLTG